MVARQRDPADAEQRRQVDVPSRLGKHPLVRIEENRGRIRRRKRVVVQDVIFRTNAPGRRLPARVFAAVEDEAKGRHVLVRLTSHGLALIEFCKRPIQLECAGGGAVGPST